MKNLNEFIVDLLNESEDAKIKELEKKLDKVEDKADKAEKEADKAKEQAKEADKEANKAEKSIKNEDDFRAFAKAKFEKVFGDNVDEDKMNSIVDGILSKYKEDAENGDWGKLAGVLNRSFSH